MAFLVDAKGWCRGNRSAHACAMTHCERLDHVKDETVTPGLHTHSHTDTHTIPHTHAHGTDTHIHSDTHTHTHTGTQSEIE